MRSRPPRATGPATARPALLAFLAFLAFLALGAPTACAPAASEGGAARRLVVDSVAPFTDQLLQAVSPVDDGAVWVSGHGGTWARSLDGGATWVSGVVEGADTLEFRDIDAFGADAAVLMSAGPGSLSRLFRTDDGGRSWTETYVVRHPDGFLDCVDFVDTARGYAYGDAVEGVLYVLETRDGGRSWARVPGDRLPPALDGEGGFAASGSCVAATPEGEAVIATGNAVRPRLLRSGGPGGWSASDLPLTAGAGAGATAVGVGPDGFAWAVGGAIGEALPGARVAVSSDGGASWEPGGDPGLVGPLYGAARAAGFSPAALVAVGPGGLTWSADGGRSWTPAHPATHWAVAFGPDGRGWAVGPGGRITLLEIEGGEGDVGDGR